MGSAMTASVVGVAQVDITPDWPVMMGGFGQRTSPSEGTLDRIFAKALYLSDGEGRLLFITADLICTPRSLGQSVVAGLAARLGLDPGEICVCASHTHSAPNPHDAGDGAIGVARFASGLQTAMIDVGVAAVRAARPGRVRTGVGALDTFFNRRTRGQPNLVDPRIPVIVADDDATGAPIAVVFGAGCHPTTLGWDNMHISGDFPGFAQRALEAASPGLVAMFFNTTEGNVIPVTSPDRDALDPRGYCGGSAHDTRVMGQALADEVGRVMARAPSAPPMRIAARRRNLRLAPNTPADDPDTLALRLEEARATLAAFLGVDLSRALPPGPLWAVASEVVLRDDLAEPDMRRLMIACCRYLGLASRVAAKSEPRPVEAPAQVMRINDFALLALPGEALVEVGQAWTALAQSPTAFVVGLANSHLRYLPMAANFDEPDADVRYETVTAGLRNGGVERLLEGGAEMLGEIMASKARR